MATVPDTQYNDVARQYESMEDLPCSQLEAQLVLEALGDCRGLKVLDLGGGSGMHARKAADLGAAVVDVVDLSTGMLQVGRDSEASLGRDLIRWHRADVSKPLDEQGIVILQPGEYDVVMANWVLDHSASPQQLRGMWDNIARYSRSGARFLGIRVANPRAECYRTGKYGVRYDDVEDVQDGIRYKVVYLTDPVLQFEGVSMAESMSLSTDIPARLGFINVQVLSPKKTPVVKGDLEYWKMYLEDPGFVAVTATKV